MTGRARQAATLVFIAGIMGLLVDCGPAKAAAFSAGQLDFSGAGNHGTATIVCESDGTVVEENYRWLGNVKGPAVGPAFAFDFRFKPEDSSKATMSLQPYKASPYTVTGTVKGVSSDAATGATSAQLLFADASYQVRYRCPDGSGPYKGTGGGARGNSIPNLEIGFSVSPGNASLSHLILYSDVAPTYQVVGNTYRLPFLLARDPGVRPISNHGFDFSVTAKLIAADGSATQHQVHITGHIIGQGIVSGTVDMSGVSSAFQGPWLWRATTGYGPQAVPTISPLKQNISNESALLEVASLVYPGGVGYAGGYVAGRGLGSYTGGSFTGAAPGPATYQPPHIGVTLPDDPEADGWGITKDESDQAVLAYAVSASAADVFNWYAQQLTDRGWKAGSGIKLNPGGADVIRLDMVKARMDVSITASSMGTCPPAYCSTFAGELNLPMVLIIKATGNSSTVPTAQPLAFPPLCPSTMPGASIVMKGLFNGTATSSCLGLWSTRSPDITCAGFMELDFVINGIPFRVNNLIEGYRPALFAFGSSDLSGALFETSPAGPVPNDQPVHISSGILTLFENLYWNTGKSPVETLAVRVPCQGLTN